MNKNNQQATIQEYDEEEEKGSDYKKISNQDFDDFPLITGNNNGDDGELDDGSIMLGKPIMKRANCGLINYPKPIASGSNDHINSLQSNDLNIDTEEEPF